MSWKQRSNRASAKPSTPKRTKTYHRDVPEGDCATGSKLPLYAEAGISEYWIVNLQERAVEVHRNPEDGRYAQVRRVGPGEPLDILLLPGLTLPTAELMR